MKRHHSTRSLDEAMGVFLKELPDPSIHNFSSVIEHFAIDGKEIMLTAQKRNGEEGMQWEIKDIN